MPRAPLSSDGGRSILQLRVFFTRSGSGRPFGSATAGHRSLREAHLEGFRARTTRGGSGLIDIEALAAEQAANEKSYDGNRSGPGEDRSGSASLGQTFAGGSGNTAWTFAYTPASQLASSATTTTLYDWASASATTVNKAADGLNRDASIAAVGGPCAPSGAGYDCNGNLTFDGTRTFTYDAENRLLSDSVGGSTLLTLAYDPLGRLWQTTAGSTVTQYLYDGDALVGEYNGSTVLQRFVHGPGVDDPVIWFAGSAMTTASASYLIADRQGSIIATTNAAGTATNTYTYDPYGNPSNWAVPAFGYTGQLALPQAQLWHNKARAYDPASGQFLQTDPIGYDDDNNLYTYVGNDPTNDLYPTGQDATVLDGVVVKANKKADTAIAGGLTIVGRISSKIAFIAFPILDIIQLVLSPIPPQPMIHSMVIMQLRLTNRRSGSKRLPVNTIGMEKLEPVGPSKRKPDGSQVRLVLNHGLAQGKR